MRFPLSTLLRLALPNLALCLAHPEPEPEPKPLPQFTNNAPFSGAIYIVNTDGQPITYTSGTNNQNLCPAHAPVSCGTINQPSWCCPNSYTCAVPSSSNGLIGCCPSGSSCAGPVNQASISTVTVYAYQQAPKPTITNVVVQGGQPYQQGFCSTMTAKGPGLPTTRQGDCGVILVVSDGVINWGVVSYMGLAVLLGLQLALSRMFRWS